jgi:hypothetical protein
LPEFHTIGFVEIALVRCACCSHGNTPPPSCTAGCCDGLPDGLRVVYWCVMRCVVFSW